MIPKTISLVAKFDSKTNNFIPFEYKGKEQFWSKKGYASIDSLSFELEESIDNGRIAAKVFICLLGVLYIGGSAYGAYFALKSIKIWYFPSKRGTRSIHKQ